MLSDEEEKILFEVGIYAFTPLVPGGLVALARRILELEKEVLVLAAEVDRLERGGKSRRGGGKP